jgi:predicted transcriptional regulator
MTVKRITLRVPPELHQHLVQMSTELNKSLNTLAVEALESYTVKAEQLPLQKMSDLLAPAAESNGLSEEELLEHARIVRQRIWKERYQKAVEAVES